MTCETCGRPAENGQATHWLGCEEPGPNRRALHVAVAAESADVCGHDGCSEPKKEWSGKGAKPKYCAAGHKKEK
jgi:hypothetical protein